MAVGITNWVNESHNDPQVKEARAMLQKVKRQRYSRGRKYELVKVCDHPLTYVEREITKKKKKEKRKLNI